MKSFFQRLLALIILSLPIFSSCSQDEVQNVYSRYRAFFNYEKVLTAHPLYAALTGTGQYCSIYVLNTSLYFQSTSENYHYNLTDADYYKQVTCIGGFIVGRSNVPDMTTGELPLLCFDRACPNCYKDDNITKPLTLKENGEAYCARCQRTYDLNNLGIIKSGDKGVKLFRYRVVYNGSNILVVNNS